MGQKYVYAVALADHDISCEASGIGGLPVYALARQGLACFLSDYSGPELGDLSKEEIVRGLLAHQAVVEKIMEKHTILPVKFGTVMAGDAEALTFLSQGHHRLAGALAQLQDKVEVEVAATWDTAQVLRELAGQEQILRAKAAITAAQPGEALQQQIRLGQTVKEALDLRRDGYRERMLAFLSPLALDVQPNVLVSDQMVMNVAFLVHRDKQRAFDDRIGQLNDLFQDQINFRIIGPLPPYSFATVEVTRPDWKTLEAARQVLHLSECVCEPEVRKAYRGLAAGAHQDLNGGNELASVQLARLRQALETLLAYCRGQASSGRGGSGPSSTNGTVPITREAVENTLLIRINRTASQEIEQSRFGGIGVRTGRTGCNGAGC